MNAVERLVDEQARRNRDAVEQACEAMLTTPGDYGVAVTYLPDGTVRAELTHDVPFGEIHYRWAQ